MVIDILLQSSAWYTGVKQHLPRFVHGWVIVLVCQFWLSLSDETLNWGPLALLLQRQYEFSFGINIVQFSFSVIVSRIVDIHIVGLCCRSETRHFQQYKHRPSLPGLSIDI